MSSVVFSADDVHPFNTRVKREGSHSAPLTKALNDHAPAASESDCDSRDLEDSWADASVAIVSVGPSQGSISVSQLASSIFSKSMISDKYPTDRNQNNQSYMSLVYFLVLSKIR